MKKLPFAALLGSALFALSSSVTASEILIPNSDFENDLATWQAFPAKPENVSIDTNLVRNGEKSLRLASTPESPNVMVFKTVNGISGNTLYHLSAWVRGGAAPAGNVTAVVKLEYYNAAGKNTSGVNGRLALPQNSDWTPINVTARADADTTYVKVYVRLMSKGEVYFDDLKLEKAALQLLPPTRLEAVAGEPVKVQLRAWTEDEWTDGNKPPFILEATGPAGVVSVAPKVTQSAPQEFLLDAELPAIESGLYQIGISSNGVSSPTTARTYMTVKNRKPQYLSETGTILRQGKPFFPIGMYHTENTEYFNPGHTDTTESTYKLLAENGINTVQGNSTFDLDALQTSLDMAQKYGLAVDVPFYRNMKVKENLAISLKKIERFKDHPAVMNWKIMDEPDLFPAAGSEVPEAYATFKKADNIRPLGVTLCTDDAIPDWANFTDIIQIDRYPIPGLALTRVSDYTRMAVRDKAEPWQNISFVIQSGWLPDLSNQPTAAQARSMVYLALIEGAKGIWWYSMYDPKWDLTKTPLWPKMKEINAEIKTLSEPLMLGEDVAGITGSNAKVLFKAKKHGDKLYLMLTNPEDAPAQFTLSFPKELALRNGRTLDGKIPVALQGRELKLSLEGIDSRTFVFDLK